VDDTLLGIGQMAKASGLTVSALRFYAGSSVLEPAVVDAATGYRLYRPSQLRDARLIAQLRRVAMPLRDIRQILAAQEDPAEVAAIIERHLRRLEAGLADAKRVLSTVQHLLHDQKDPMPTTNDALAGLSDRHLHSGKVRELYSADDGSLLVVATDRISAYDYVLPTDIPDKGVILSQLSSWWFDELGDLAPNHVITADVADYPSEFRAYEEALHGRSMLCRRLTMVPVECVARGYLTGSALADYERTGSVHGVALPSGLLDGSQLPEPIFTPTTKAPIGEHDEPMTYDDVVATVGVDRAEQLRTLTLDVYRRATEQAASAGVILADTKLEFGVAGDGTLMLADEVLTPDSSRFWPAEGWQPGEAQPSYDKQFVRDWLTGSSGWDRTGPPPPLPDAVVEQTRAKYVEAYERLTGRRFETDEQRQRANSG
jgi:phosphoribosylaminoimidazole-succinocarboxamide synthase